LNTAAVKNRDLAGIPVRANISLSHFLQAALVERFETEEYAGTSRLGSPARRALGTKQPARKPAARR
jgi:hypothetical protein